MYGAVETMRLFIVLYKGEIVAFLFRFLKLNSRSFRHRTV